MMKLTWMSTQKSIPTPTCKSPTMRCVATRRFAVRRLPPLGPVIAGPVNRGPACLSGQVGPFICADLIGRCDPVVEHDVVAEMARAAKVQLHRFMHGLAGSAENRRPPLSIAQQFGRKENHCLVNQFLGEH